MKKFLFIIAIVFAKTLGAQNTNFFDYAGGATVTTNGTQWSGGASARAHNSNTSLTAGQYIIFDMRTEVPIHSISFGTYWSSDPRFIPLGYTIAYSADGITYTNSVVETNNSNVNPVHNSLNAPASRFWKLTVTALQAGQTSCSIANFRLVSHGVGSATSEQFWTIGGFNSPDINYMAGNVGIGTVIPNRMLHIAGKGTSFGQMIENTGTAVSETSRLSFKTASGGSDNRAGAIEWYEANTFKGDIRLLRNGGIEIRNQNDQPIFHLTNTGDIFSKKIKVTQTGWPDYVFSPSYQLPSLEEVKKFIAKHQHLPGVPSAAEVEKKGLDLGDNQAVLLKKIEELTLYIINQQETLNRQQQQLDGLQKQLKAAAEKK